LANEKATSKDCVAFVLLARSLLHQSTKKILTQGMLKE
jgi:hypothetical protein